MTDLHDEPDLALIGIEPDYDTEPQTPADEVQADRWLAALLYHRRHHAEVTALFDKRIDDLMTRHRELTARYDRRITWLTHALEQYHRARLAENPKAATVRLPSGDLASSKLSDKWDFGPEYIAWAEVNRPDALLHKPTVVMVAAKAGLSLVGETVVDSAGQIVPGVTVTTAAERGGRSFRIVPPAPVEGDDGTVWTETFGAGDR